MVDLRKTGAPKRTTIDEEFSMPFGEEKWSLENFLRWDGDVRGNIQENVEELRLLLLGGLWASLNNFSVKHKEHQPPHLCNEDYLKSLTSMEEHFENIEEWRTGKVLRAIEKMFEMNDGEEALKINEKFAHWCRAERVENPAEKRCREKIESLMLRAGSDFKSKKRKSL